jgi:hypothetical protein
MLLLQLLLALLISPLLVKLLAFLLLFLLQLLALLILLLVHVLELLLMLLLELLLVGGLVWGSIGRPGRWWPVAELTLIICRRIVGGTLVVLRTIRLLILGRIVGPFIRGAVVALRPIRPLILNRIVRALHFRTPIIPFSSLRRHRLSRRRHPHLALPRVVGVLLADLRKRRWLAAVLLDQSLLRLKTRRRRWRRGLCHDCPRDYLGWGPDRCGTPPAGNGLAFRRYRRDLDYNGSAGNVALIDMHHVP